jgi:hypothetical protein
MESSRLQDALFTPQSGTSVSRPTQVWFARKMQKDGMVRDVVLLIIDAVSL